MKLIKEGNEVNLMKKEIELNNKFYPIQSIEESANDFKNVCKITIEKKATKTKVTFSAEKLDKKTAGEFCNYCFAITKQNGRLR